MDRIRVCNEVLFKGQGKAARRAFNRRSFLKSMMHGLKEGSNERDPGARGRTSQLKNGTRRQGGR